MIIPFPSMILFTVILPHNQTKNDFTSAHIKKIATNFNAKKNDVYDENIVLDSFVIKKKKRRTKKIQKQFNNLLRKMEVVRSAITCLTNCFTCKEDVISQVSFVVLILYHEYLFLSMNDSIT